MMEAFEGRERARIDEIREQIFKTETVTALVDGSRINPIARELLIAFRREGVERSSIKAAAVVDGLVRSTRDELMDAEWIPAWVRRIEMTTLDRVNEQLGSYHSWQRALERLTHGASDVRAVDLAAGSGGFFRFLARSGFARARRWSLLATDIERSYVAQGVAACARDGVEDVVRCEVRSAVELEDLRGRADLFVCTQALHHMPPGLVLRVIAGAIRVAPRGIVLIDLIRGATLATLSAGVLAAVARVPFVVVDGVQSVRRAYLPGELALLARIAGATEVDARWDPPAHQIVYARR